jgi:hypothetical protein
LLQFTRLNHEGNADVRYSLIAEADGPVLHTFLQVNPVSGGCYIHAEALQENKYLWRMSGDTWDEPGFGSVEGFLAGDLDTPLPAVVFKQPKQPGLGSNWEVSAHWLVQKVGPRFVRPWEDVKQSTLIHGAAQDPDGYFASIVVPVGKHVFLGIGEAAYHGISIWSPDKGLQPWQRWSGDFTRGAGNVGTDGKDVVWTYGEGKKPTEYEFPSTSVYTAPFATEMGTIEATKRRLRSDVTRPGDARYQYAVGCGYAARLYFEGGKTSNLFIVRLSDGRGWKIPGFPDGPSRLSWGSPLAISCEHIYVPMSLLKESVTIARIPLSSLGPGLPAD